MYKLVFLIVFALFANANDVELLSGQINAHTEVFGDSTIDPQTKSIKADLSKEENIESLKGHFEIEALSLTSDNKDRDKHMYEVLNSVVSPKISFDISTISKDETGYTINGLLKMNNIEKAISSNATILEENSDITIDGNFSIKLTDFNLEPPTMFFLIVRDQIDIKYNFNLLEKK